MASIYHLSWGKTSFPAKLRLFRESRKHEGRKIRCRKQMTQADGCSALSSTYYSIVGTVVAKLKATLRPWWLAPLVFIRVPLWCITWLPLGTWCYLKMLPISDQVVALVGYEGMNANQCNIRGSILCRRRKFKEAERCILWGLSKNPEQAHTRGLLHVDLADIYRRRGEWKNVEAQLRSAFVAAEEAEKEDARQASRIYRHCANLLDTLPPGHDMEQRGGELRRKAVVLAELTGANDQLLKQRR